MNRRVWSGDWKWVMREALAAYQGPVVLVTITAPGSDVLADDDALDEWSATIPARWRSLHKAARERALRASRASSGRTVLAYAWQLQRRGAPHVHVAVPAGPLGLRYAYALKASAAGYGFGFVDIRRGGGSAPAVGSYLSRYLTRDTQELTRTSNRLPLRPVYVDPRLARAAGVSMRLARAIRRLWVYHHRDPDPRFIREPDDRLRMLTRYWYRRKIRGPSSVAASEAYLRSVGYLGYG